MQPSITEMTFSTADQCSAVFQHLQLLLPLLLQLPACEEPAVICFLSPDNCHWNVSLQTAVTVIAASLACECSKETRQSDAWMAAAPLQGALPWCGKLRQAGDLKERTVFHALQSQGSPTDSSLDREEFGAVSLLLEQLGRISDPSLQLLIALGEYLVSATVQKVTRPPLYLWPTAMSCWWAEGCAGGWETGTHFLLLLPVPSLPPLSSSLGLRSESLKAISTEELHCLFKASVEIAALMPELVSPHKRVCMAQIMC